MASRRKAASRPARKARASATPGPAGVREQLDATIRILHALAVAPGNLQAVLDAVAEQAARVCGATDSLIHRIDGIHAREDLRLITADSRRAVAATTFFLRISGKRCEDANDQTDDPSSH